MIKAEYFIEVFHKCLCSNEVCLKLKTGQSPIQDHFVGYILMIFHHGCYFWITFQKSCFDHLLCEPWDYTVDIHRIVTGNECYNRAVSAVFSQGIQSFQAKQQRVRCGECWRLAFFIHWRRPRPNHISTTQALSHYWHVSLCRSVWFTFNACCECIKCRALCRGWLAGHWSGWRTLEINQFQSMAGQWVHL